MSSSLDRSSIRERMAAAAVQGMRAPAASERQIDEIPMGGEPMEVPDL